MELGKGMKVATFVVCQLNLFMCKP